MPAESLGHAVVARGQQRGADLAPGAVLAQLDLEFGIPARVVADHRDERQLVAHRRVDLGGMESEGSVAHARDHGRLGQRDASGERERECHADRARDSVDHAMRRGKARLRPLAELSAVGNEDGVGMRVEQRLQRPQRLHRVQAVRLLRCGVRPRRRAVGDRRAHFARPIALQRCVSLRAAGEHARRRERLRTPRGEQPLPDRSLRAVEFLGLAIRLDELAFEVDRRGAPEFQREVELLAEEQDAIGVGEHSREGPQARIGDAARAFHADRGNTGRRFQRRRRLPAGSREERRPRENEGALRFHERFEQIIGVARDEDFLLGPEILGAHQAFLRLRFEMVAGKAHVHRAAAARSRRANGAHHVRADLLHAAVGPRFLGHGCGDIGLLHFLERAAVPVRARRVAGKQHHRRLGKARRHGVGVPGTAGHERDAGLAGDPRVRIRHVHGRGFVTHVDEIDARVERRIEDRHDVVARQREDALHAGEREGRDERVRAAVLRISQL